MLQGEESTDTEDGDIQEPALKRNRTTAAFQLDSEEQALALDLGGQSPQQDEDDNEGEVDADINVQDGEGDGDNDDVVQATEESDFVDREADEDNFFATNGVGRISF